MIDERESKMEITIDNANITMMLGCERNAFDEKAKGNITVFITSSTDIDIEKFEKFAGSCNGKKQRCKLVLKKERGSDRLYSSEKVY